MNHAFIFPIPDTLEHENFMRKLTKDNIYHKSVVIKTDKQSMGFIILTKDFKLQLMHLTATKYKTDYIWLNSQKTGYMFNHKTNSCTFLGKLTKNFKSSIQVFDKNTIWGFKK